MTNNSPALDAAPSAESSLSAQELLFKRRLGQAGLTRAPVAYRLLAIDEGGSGGLLVDIPWGDMLAVATQISIHEDAFAWAAIQNSARDVHASLLDCAIFEATRANDLKRSQAPRALFQGVFDDYQGQGFPGFFEAVSTFRDGSPAQLAQGLTRIFPSSNARFVAPALCKSVFPGKLESPHPQLWRALVEAAELGSQAAPASKASSRLRV